MKLLTYYAGVALPIDDNNAKWQCIGQFDSEDEAKKACINIANTLPYDAYSVLASNSDSPMLAKLQERLPIAPYCIYQHTHYPDTMESLEEAEINYSASVLPPHLLVLDEIDASRRFLYLKPYSTPEEAIASAKRYCHQRGWQALKVQAKIAEAVRHHICNS